MFTPPTSACTKGFYSAFYSILYALPILYSILYSILYPMIYSILYTPIHTCVACLACFALCGVHALETILLLSASSHVWTKIWCGASAGVVEVIPALAALVGLLLARQGDGGGARQNYIMMATPSQPPSTQTQTQARNPTLTSEPPSKPLEALHDQ